MIRNLGFERLTCYFLDQPSSDSIAQLVIRNKLDYTPGIQYPNPPYPMERMDAEK